MFRKALVKVDLGTPFLLNMNRSEYFKRTYPPQNTMLIAVFYQLLLFIGDHIFWGSFKLGDEAVDLSGVNAKYFGIGEGVYFI